MADESDPRDVLSSLPRSRPQRRSAKRDGGARAKKKGTVKPAARPSAATKRAHASAVPGTRPAARSRSSAPPAEGLGSSAVGTAVEAAGEVARLGLSVGTYLLREAARRLPKPR